MKIRKWKKPATLSEEIHPYLTHNSHCALLKNAGKVKKEIPNIYTIGILSFVLSVEFLLIHRPPAA